MRTKLLLAEIVSEVEVVSVRKGFRKKGVVELNIDGNRLTLRPGDKAEVNLEGKYEGRRTP